MDSNSWLETFLTLASLWRLLYIDLPMLAVLRLMGVAEHMATSDNLEEAKLEFRAFLDSVMNCDLGVARDKFVGCLHNLANYNFCAALVGDLDIDVKDDKKDSAICLVEEDPKDDKIHNKLDKENDNEDDNEDDKEDDKELDNDEMTRNAISLKDDDSEPRSDDNSCEASNNDALLLDQGRMEEAEALVHSDVAHVEDGGEVEGADEKMDEKEDEKDEKQEIEKGEKQEMELKEVEQERKRFFTEDLLKNEHDEELEYIETLVEPREITIMDDKKNERKDFEKSNFEETQKSSKTEMASEKKEENLSKNSNVLDQNQSFVDKKSKKSDQTENTNKIDDNETKLEDKNETKTFSKTVFDSKKELKSKSNSEFSTKPLKTLNSIELSSNLETICGLESEKMDEVNKRYSFQEVQKMLETSVLPSELNLQELEVDSELQSPLASSEDLDKIDTITFKEDSKYKSATWTRKSSSKSAIKESNSFSMTNLKQNSYSDLEKIPRGIVSELHQDIEAKTKSSKISDRRPWMLHSLTGRSKSLSPMTRAIAAEKSADTKEDKRGKGESGRKGNNMNKGEGNNNSKGTNVAKSTKQALKTFFKKGPELSRLSRKSRSSVTLTKTWEESRSFEHSVTWQSSKVVDLPDSFGLEVFKDNSSNNEDIKDNKDNKESVVAIKNSSGTNKGTKSDWPKLKRSKTVRK